MTRPWYRRAVSVSVGAGILVLLAAQAGFAHDASITSLVRVFIDEVGQRRYSLTTVDAGVPAFSEQDTLLPSHCAPLRSSDSAPRKRVAGLTFECEHALTSDDEIALPLGLPVIGVARWSNGTGTSAYFVPDAFTVRLRMADLGTAVGSRWHLVNSLAWRGVEHVIYRRDQVLFILILAALGRGATQLCALVIVAGLGGACAAVLTLNDLLSADSDVADAAKAIMLILCAREVIVTQRDARENHRSTWLAAAVFGFWSGLDFQRQAAFAWLRNSNVLAVLAFYLGAGTAQGMLLVWLSRVDRSVGVSMPRHWKGARAVVGYVIGTLATYWVFSVPMLTG